MSEPRVALRCLFIIDDASVIFTGETDERKIIDKRPEAQRNRLSGSRDVYITDRYFFIS